MQDWHRLYDSVKIVCASLFLKLRITRNETADTLMTRIRVSIRVCQQNIKTPARLRTGHGKSTMANVCGDF